MSVRLGQRQLELLRSVGTQGALVIATPRSRRLCALGLMREASPDAFVCITPEGLRALADAVDEGRITLFTLKQKQEQTP